jgi:hypothetical protein
MSTWRNFSDTQARSIADGAVIDGSGFDSPCPNCGVAIRHYSYQGGRGHRSTLVSYTWCSACKLFLGATGPFPAGLQLVDPLGNLLPNERLRLEEDVDAFFLRLDSLWRSGELPQEFNAPIR